MEEQERKPRTPTEVLVRCMEDFGDDEPLETIVIWRSKSGAMSWASNIEPNSHFIGTLRMTEFYFLEKRKKEAEYPS